MPWAPHVLCNWAKCPLFSFSHSQEGLALIVLHHQRPRLLRGSGRREGVQSEDAEGAGTAPFQEFLTQGLRLMKPRREEDCSSWEKYSNWLLGGDRESNRTDY